MTMYLTYPERRRGDLFNRRHAADEQEQSHHKISYIFRNWCRMDLSPILEQDMSCATMVSMLICDTINERMHFFNIVGLWSGFKGKGVSSIDIADRFYSIASCSSIDSRHCTR